MRHIIKCSYWYVTHGTMCTQHQLNYSADTCVRIPRRALSSEARLNCTGHNPEHDKWCTTACRLAQGAALSSGRAHTHTHTHTLMHTTQQALRKALHTHLSWSCRQPQSPIGPSAHLPLRPPHIASSSLLDDPSHQAEQGHPTPLHPSMCSACLSGRSDQALWRELPLTCPCCPCN